MPKLELPEEPGTAVAEEIIFNLFPEWWAKFAQKNTAYGDRLSTGGNLGIKAFIPEMNRKMQGIINQVWEGQPQGVGESAREKAMDLIGHLFIFVANLDAEAEVPLPFDDQGRARSALGWPRPKPMTYEQLQERGWERVRQAAAEAVGIPIEQVIFHKEWIDSSLEPWRNRFNPKPNVAVDPMTGDLQPHPLMRGGPFSKKVAGDVRTVNEEAPIPCPEWCPERTDSGALLSIAQGHYWFRADERSGFVAHTPEYHATLRDPNDPQGEYYEEPSNWHSWEPED